jgi:signal transduction histidine kinase
LRELNAVLEERIQHRTERLTKANAALSRAFDDLKSTQAMLVRSEKLASLGSLVAGVAHELNTPIGNGLMAVSTLDQRLKDFRAALSAGLRRSDLDAFVAQVGTAADISTRNLMRASELISSFKQVAVDQTSSQRRRFSMEALVNEILLTLQPIFKHVPYQVVVEVPQDITVDSYPGPLGQVLTNLIQNAVVHAFKDRSHGQIRVSVHLHGAEQVELRVQDDGRGIPANQIDKVFDPFFTTRLGEGGSGLGLHISHNIVTGLLAGQIQVRNRPEGGAEFAILFPVNAPQRANSPTPLT